MHFDCSALWVTQRNDLIRAFTVNPEYLKNHASDAGQVLDFRHMQVRQPHSYTRALSVVLLCVCVIGHTLEIFLSFCLVDIFI